MSQSAYHWGGAACAKQCSVSAHAVLALQFGQLLRLSLSKGVKERDTGNVPVRDLETEKRRHLTRQGFAGGSWWGFVYADVFFLSAKGLSASAVLHSPITPSESSSTVRD